MQNFNTPERRQVSTHVTCAIFHEYWEWGWASSSPAAHTPGRQSSPHPGPAEGCSPSLEFFQALSSTPELEGAQVHLLPPQPIQVRSIPHWPHLGWHCCLSKCQEKLGQNYHKLDLMETFFQRQEIGVKFSSTLKDTGWNGRSRAQLQHFPGQWGLLSTASFKPVCSYTPSPPAAGIYIYIYRLHRAFDVISHHYNLPLSRPDIFPTWSDTK